MDCINSFEFFPDIKRWIWYGFKAWLVIPHCILCVQSISVFWKFVWMLQEFGLPNQTTLTKCNAFLVIVQRVSVFVHRLCPRFSCDASVRRVQGSGSAQLRRHSKQPTWSLRVTFEFLRLHVLHFTSLWPKVALGKLRLIPASLLSAPWMLINIIMQGLRSSIEPTLACQVRLAYDKTTVQCKGCWFNTGATSTTITAPAMALGEFSSMDVTVLVGSAITVGIRSEQKLFRAQKDLTLVI